MTCKVKIIDDTERKNNNQDDYFLIYFLMDYTVNGESLLEPGASMGLFAMQIVIGIFILVACWKLFVKAGKPGWGTLIPIYNTILQLQIVKKPWWWIFLFLIPFANIYFAIVVMHRLSLSFGKEAGFTVGLIFLPIVFYPILAFGDAQYKPLTD